ncbi:MAG: hypothetical protein QF645_00755 [Planctomycetota bacterium]|nr:hypothetical protein [Planctomycetota bacterium]
MKFVLSLLLLSLSFTSLSAQEEIPLEEVFQKIEARLAPIDSLEGRIRVEGGTGMGAELNVAGWVGFRRGEFLWRQSALWKMPEGMFLKEDYHSPSTVAVRGLFTGGQRGEALAYAYKSAPGKASTRRTGMTAMLEMLTGTEWSLWEVALWPRQLLSRYTEVKAYREKDSIVIKSKWEIPVMMGQGGDALKMEWYFNADHRMEKMVLDMQGQSMEVTVREYAKVQGVEIPCRVEYRDLSMIAVGRGALVTLILDQIQSPAEAESTKGPQWLDDPALPEATTQTLEEAENRLEEDPTNGALLLEVGNLAMVNSTRSGRNMSKWAKKLGAYTEAAMKASPESSLLLLSHFVTQAMDKKMVPVDLLESLLKKKVLAFDALAAAVMISIGNGEQEKAQEFLLQISEQRVAGAFRKKVGLKLELQRMTSAEEFIKRVDRELEGRTLEEKLSILSAISPPVRRFGRSQSLLLQKDPDFLKELVKTQRSEYLLLAARAYFGKGEFAEAVTVYLQLADLPEYAPHLKTEWEEVCKKGEEDAIPLLEKIYDSIEDPELLLIAAKNAFETKKELQFLSYKKRLIAVCSKEETSSRPARNFRNTEKLIPFLDALVNAERIEDAKEFLLAYTNKGNASNLLYGKGESLLPKILAEDFEAKYRFLKCTGPPSHALRLIKVDAVEFISEVRRRVESGTYEKDDLESLSQVVLEGLSSLQSDVVTPGILAALFEKGSKAYPKEGSFFERLGDCRYYEKEFAKAVLAYQEVFRLRKMNGKKTPNMMMQVMSRAFQDPTDATKKEKGLDVSQPVLAKMAYAYLAEGREADAVKAVEQFLLDFPGPEDITEASVAYKVLKMDERILPLKRKLFLEQLKDERRIGWGDPALETGFDLLELYKKSKKYIEGSLVVGLLENRMSEEGNPEHRKKLDKYREEFRAKVTQEDLIAEFLKTKIDPVSSEKKSQIDDLIEKMDADEIDLRDEAFEALRKMSPDVSPYLAEQIEGQSIEVASRLKEILVAHAEKALRQRFRNP